MKKHLIFGIFFLSTLGIYAQGNLSFYQLRDLVPQTQSLTPTNMPENGFTFSIPALNSSLQATTDFPIQNLIVQRGNGNLAFDFDSLLSVSEDNNTLGTDLTTNLFHLQLTRGKGSFTVFSNLRAEASLNYTSDLVNLLANGNGQSLGETILLEERIDLTTYNEIGVGYARSFLDDKLVIGVRAKYLNGQFYAGTGDNGSLGIYTDPSNYNITLTSNDISIQTAGTDILLNSEDYESSALTNYVTWTDNTGFAADIGATFKFNNFTFEASVTDIGSITWREQVINYVLPNETTTLAGVDLDNSEDPTTEIQDQIDDFFETQETYEEFTTTLNMKTYVSASYTMNDAHRFGLTMYNNNIYGEFTPSYAVAYNWFLGKKTTVGALTSFGGQIEEPRFGANIATNLGFLQFYAATDNFLNLTKPEEGRGADIRFGINIMLGYNRI